ncbi:MAG: glycerophosphodiester phosphodiesterase [Caldilineaceae bacterium]|nr:glycerophosphodiester phosphodiesterase [Caldilineaceae bacterium]
MLKRISIATGLLLLLLVAYLYFPWPIPPAASFEVVAHRGVHQTFPLDNLTNETCTGKIIYPPSHAFLENTLPSMQEAFAQGATAVELDIHRTADNHLIVFHDWTVDCRTDGTGVTNEQTLAYLQSLDIAYGYTADDGKTFPLRGTGVGMMPTLEEVLNTFPGKHFVINNKDGGDETVELLADFLAERPAEDRARLSYWGVEYALLHEKAPDVSPYLFTAADVKACLGDYLLRMLMTGALSAQCRQNIIAVPFAMLDSVPGWPNLILARAHQAGAKVYVIDVDTPEQLEAVWELPLDGIQTNRIEIIGPLLKERP